MRTIAATALLAGLLAACASGPQVNTQAIRAMLDAGRLEPAIASLEQALAGAPGHIEARVLLADARRQLARRLLDQAAQEMQRGAWDAAQANYRRAAVYGEVDQAMAGQRALAIAQEQDRHAQDAVPLAAAARSAQASEAAQAAQTGMAVQSGRATGPDPALQQKIKLQFRDAPVRGVLEALSLSSGINFTLDKDVPPDLRISVHLADVTFDMALRHVLLAAQLERAVLDARTMLIYASDPAKQRQHQQLAIRSFRITNAEARTVANSLRTLLKTRDLVVDEKLNMLVLRDSPETIQMAARLVALHDVAEPEVMLEVEILEVQRSDLEALGVKWPANIGLSPLATTRAGADGAFGNSVLTLRDLTRLNARGIVASVDPMTLSASLNRDNVSVLANPRIRIKNREKALIKVGERVPSVSANVTSTGVTSQSVNYLDVGLKLEAEPVVYLDDEVSIKLNLEVSSILGTVFDSNHQPYGYRIGARNASTVLRLRDGETQVLAGLISDNDKRSSSALPGIGQLPLLDRLFGRQENARTKTEIVLSITPRVLRSQPRAASADIEFDAGTDAGLRGRDGPPLPASLAAPLPAPAPAPPPASGERAGG